MLEKFLAILDKETGNFTISKTDKEWLCALSWGKEAPDSPMVGAEAIGVGQTAEEALDMLIAQLPEVIND